MGKSTNFFKQNRMFYVFVFVLLNIAYVSIEIYKSIISEPLLFKNEITQSEFAEVQTLSNFAYFFEISFLILSIIWTLFMFSKKYKYSLRRSLFIQLLLLIALFILNCTLSWLFDVPVGNLVQLLFGPFVFVIGALIYVTLSYFFTRMKRLLSHR